MNRANLSTNGLQPPNACPVCHSRGISGKIDNLKDALYGIPGQWSFMRCQGCRSYFLHPWPKPSDLILFYSNYYTHQQPSAPASYDSLNFFRKIRRRLVNGYTNHFFETQNLPAFPTLGKLLFLLPNVAATLNREYRHLPTRDASSKNLLDVGCGSIFFLSRANACGWRGVGLDFDPVVVSQGMSQGFNMLEGGTQTALLTGQRFDYITMSHVLEHLPCTNEAIKDCFELLKPGGVLWIETPNACSFGLSIFQRNWRGLEPPRHLVLLNQKSIRAQLSLSGFENIRHKMRPNPAYGLFLESYEIARARKPGVLIRLLIRFLAFLVSLLTLIFTSKSEYITVTAQRPIH